MHYFKRNIGDYHKKAGRLSMIEHGAYTLLLDSCYDRERFPTIDDAIEWTWARSDEEIAAVRFVLSKFFVLTDGLYVQNRISEEIEQYHLNSATNKRIALEREEARRTKRERTVHEAPPNQEPRTKNHKPLKENTTPSALLSSLEISETVSQDFISLRNRLKAPITKTSLAGIQREALKAGISLQDALQICCERSWRGFKSEWLKEKIGSVQDARLDTARQIFGGLNGNNRQIIDINTRPEIESDRACIPEINDGVWESDA